MVAVHYVFFYHGCGEGCGVVAVVVVSWSASKGKIYVCNAMYCLTSNVSTAACTWRAKKRQSPLASGPLMPGRTQGHGIMPHSTSRWQ